MMFRNKIVRGERLKLVALALAAGKSNRAIAEGLDVDEATIRRDRRLLAGRGELGSGPPVAEVREAEKGVTDLPPEEQTRTVENLAELSLRWADGRGLQRTDFQTIIDGASKTLFYYRAEANSVAVLDLPPRELFDLSRPKRQDPTDMPGRINFCVDWLARWIAPCLPAQTGLQDRLLALLLAATETR